MNDSGSTIGRHIFPLKLLLALERLNIFNRMYVNNQFIYIHYGA
jgi:hypothetical protein